LRAISICPENRALLDFCVAIVTLSFRVDLIAAEQSSGIFLAKITNHQIFGGSFMDTEILTSVLIIAALAVVALGVWFYYRRRTSENLKERFGPEYDNTVRQFKSQTRAETELKARQKRVSSYNIVALPRAERVRYRETWTAVQGEFVDQPEKAVRDADRLVQEVMERCGYPLRDFDQAAADLSVDHPHVVENYRCAYRIAERSRRGATDTEELRKAVVYYRALFEDLLEEEAPRDEKPRHAARVREASHSH
jgi:hypothetical protein